MIKVRTCPVCQHRQASGDPTGHVCAQVLRQRLRDMGDALSLAHAQLDVIGEIVEHSDPVEGVRHMRRTQAEAERWASRAYARGYRCGVETLIALVHGALMRLRWSKWPAMWLTRKVFDRASYEIRMQNLLLTREARRNECPPETRA